jgi:4,5:9,10-diseco-3-hydroxy-5,9,17-trioxoandrosta-1(10),2-diene-4-oate hydrolase
MEMQLIAASPIDARLERYRSAEAALWDVYGLTPTERFIEVGSATRLRVVEIGSGHPVVFIGGTGGTGPYWGPLIRELHGFRCLMLDRPGWGLSTPVDYSKHPYGRFVADMLRDAIDALGVERAHIVGASIGDVWALRLAQLHPDRVGRVVLLGGGPVVGEIKPPAFIRLLASPVGALIVRIPQKPDRVRSILRGIGHGPSLDAGRIPEEFVNWRVAFERETGAMRHERSMVRAIVAGRDFRPGLRFESDELSGIRPATLMVFGSADAVGSPDVWRRAMARMPNGRLRVVDGAGHMPWFDDAGGVGGEVRQFLTSQ